MFLLFFLKRDALSLLCSYFTERGVVYIVLSHYSGVPNNRVDVFVFPVLEMHARLDYLDNLLIFPFTKKDVNSFNQNQLDYFPVNKKVADAFIWNKLDC